MTTRAGLAAHLDRLDGVAVGCVGDLMLDRFVSGSVERISPEAPVPVLRVESERAMPGGAGNVVRNLAALGARTRFAAVVGDDTAGGEIAAALRVVAGAEVTLLVDAGRQTSIKTRFLAAGQQLLRADAETVRPLSASVRARLLDAGREIAAESRVVVLSDYAKGALLGDVAAALVAHAHAAGSRVVVDPKGPDYARYRGADVVTPNLRELADAAGTPVAASEAAECARALRRRHGFGSVLVTLGRDGMLLVEGEGDARALPAEAREVFDVSGAGDTVVATVAAALAAGAPLLDAAALANIAAGIVVGKVGTAVATTEEIAQVLRRRDLPQADGKRLDLDALVERIERWRRRGLRVGFTNGCFDLIHPGHVSLLRQARAACDRLVVGLNSDASVTRLKGPGRPVQGEAARAAVLAAMDPVDAVVVFGEDTPLELVRVLRPDVLVKGADYRVEDVVGADLVQAWGGRVVLARLEPGYSTTATIAALR